jgi:hypothetical protein
MNARVALAAAALALAAEAAAQGPRAQAAREAAEYVVSRFGGRAGNAARLATRIERYAAAHGDDMLRAVRRVGPEAFALVDAAGAQGARAAGLLARHGERGAAHVLSRPRGMAQFLRYGDEAAEALVRHPGVAEPLVERAGLTAVKAFNAVGPQAGRRVAIALEGELAQCGRHPELLAVIAKFGERAAAFVWDNKGALAAGAVLAAFLADPEPFLDGARQLAAAAVESAAEHVAAPLAREAARGVSWGLVSAAALGATAGLALLAVRAALRRRGPKS